MAWLERKMPWLLVLPLVVAVLALLGFPSIYAYWASLHRVVLGRVHDAVWVGLFNYAIVLTDSDFWRSLEFSAIFAVLVTTLEVAAGLALALLFHRSFRYKGAAISALLVPMMVSPALLTIMFRLMLNEFIGVVPYYLSRLGLQVDPLSPRYVIPTLMLVDIFQWVPFAFVILYAGLQALPDEPFEAALVDGASRWQLFRYVTLPMLTPVLALTLFLRGVDAFKVFDSVYVLTNGGPGTMTTTASLYVYKLGFVTGNLGQAMAAAVILLLVLSLPLGVAVRYVLRQEGTA